MLRLSTSQRGFGLFDAMIAFSILAFGLLTMTRFQFRLIAQATEAQQRGTATQLADELLNTMLVDAGSATCYTLPAAGACANPAAMARAANWQARVMANLPGAIGASSTGTPPRASSSYPGCVTRPSSPTPRAPRNSG